MTVSEGSQAFSKSCTNSCMQFDITLKITEECYTQITYHPIVYSLMKLILFLRQINLLR